MAEEFLNKTGLDTLWAKIKSRIADDTAVYATHIADNTIHITAAERTKWNGMIPSTEKGAASGVATLGTDGKIPAAQLPGYVDDVIDGYLYNGKFYEDSAHTKEITGEKGKLYVDQVTGTTYRWSGTSFGAIKSDHGHSNLAVLDGIDESKVTNWDTAYTHSQSTHARVDATKVESSSTNGNIKINGTETTVYTHPTSAGNKHIPTGGASGNFLKWSSSGTATWSGVAKSDVGLSNVTNNAQVKGLASGTTENHVLVWGADGYTVKDSGFTIASSVPANAKFTDTVTTVENVLTSTSTTNALSAAQGKALKELIDTTCSFITRSGSTGSYVYTIEEAATSKFVSGTMQYYSDGGIYSYASGTATRKDSDWDTAYNHSQSEHARVDATKVEASSTNGKIKINGTETTVYTHPTTTGNKHIPSGGSANQYLKWSADGTATWASFSASTVGLGNVTNNKQVKGLASGTTAGHVVTWGADGYTVADSGFTIATSVPADAVFTDTVTTVENVLTSDSTVNALSAAQGKALKGLIDAKVSAVNADWNATSGLAKILNKPTAITTEYINALS